MFANYSHQFSCTDTPSLQHHDIYNVPRHFQTQRKWFFEPLVTALEILYLPNCPSSVDIDFYTADFFPAFIKYGFILSSLHHINLLKVAPLLQ